MKELNYTSVDRIFKKISSDLGIDDFSESDVIDWTGEALEAIDAVTMLEEAVEFVVVKNHMAELPQFTSSIIQIAQFNGDYTKNTASCLIESVTPEDENIVYKDICAEEQSCNCTGVAKYIPVDENNYPIFDVDLYEWKPTFNIQANFKNWKNSKFFKENWIPVRLTNHTFFNSLVCTEPNADSLYKSCSSGYTIIGDSTIRFSFQEGYVAIAHNRQKLDERGRPMIPDHISYTEAITKYITMKLMGRMWYSGREGYEKRYLKAETEWQWYCKQAGNRGLMPRGIDQYQNMLDQRQYFLPDQQRYRKFFRDLSHPERRNYNQ